MQYLALIARPSSSTSAHPHARAEAEAENAYTYHDCMCTWSPHIHSRPPCAMLADLQLGLRFTEMSAEMR